MDPVATHRYLTTFHSKDCALRHDGEACTCDCTVTKPQNKEIERLKAENAKLRDLADLLYERMMQNAFRPEGDGYGGTENRHYVCKCCMSPAQQFDIETIEHDPTCRTDKAIRDYKKLRGKK